jgi:hypothetical protein
VNLELWRFSSHKAENALDGGNCGVHVEVHMVARCQLCSRSVTFDSRSDTLCKIFGSLSSFR